MLYEVSKVETKSEQGVVQDRFVIVPVDSMKFHFEEWTAWRPAQPLVKIGTFTQHVPAPVRWAAEVERQVEVLARLADIPLPRFLVITLDIQREHTGHDFMYY